MIISGWGRFPKIECSVFRPKNMNELKKLIKDRCIPRGNGRSYGDSSLQPNATIEMKNFNKIFFFNQKKGIIKAEAGILLNDLLQVIIPKGWFIPVSPGTKFVTLGGMVASNVHGKNHHNVGGIINFLENITLLNENKKIITCSKFNNKNIFYATCGGMGLTGFIIDITLKLHKITNSYIDQNIICTKNLIDTLKELKKSTDASYSVAWIDCAGNKNNFGRSVVFTGEHNESKKRKLFYKKRVNISIPFFLLSFLMSYIIIYIFNFIYYYFNFFKKKNSTICYESYFYPLDSISNWNKLYGKDGFIQYQFFIPEKNSYQAIHKILKLIQNKKCVSFLTTLKYMGEDNAMLAFAGKGFALAFDFKNIDNNLKLLEKIDKIVIHFNGRIYLTKDSRIEKNTFYKMYRNLKIFKKTIRNFKNKRTFSSLQSERICL
jgi:decaprenylphospho-beta-D-ribofuranose 2-oxidase